MARKKKSDDDPEDKPKDDFESADDSFGLPDIDYKPLEREEESKAETSEAEMSEGLSQPPEPEAQAVKEEPSYSYSSYMQEERSSSLAPRIIGIIVVILVALAATWYFGMYQPEQEKARLEEQRQQEQREAQQREEAERQAQLERDRAAVEQRNLDSLANLPREGTVQMLQDRTGKYYVVIASAIDDDLLMDHAQQLSMNNISSSIIPPFGKYRFYRLTIADGETFTVAQDTANELKTEFGQGLWVLRY